MNTFENKIKTFVSIFTFLLLGLGTNLLITTPGTSALSSCEDDVCVYDMDDGDYHCEGAGQYPPGEAGSNCDVGEDAQYCYEEECEG